MRSTTGMLGALIVASSLVSMRAQAEGAKQQCIRSAERAQQLRLDGKLVSARAELFSCVRAGCPTVVRSHCTRWFDQVEAAIPTVVIRVKDEAGNDLDDVSVAVDGKPIDNWRGGLPVMLDPGDHTFAYSRAGAAPVQNRVVLGTGEKNRLLTVTLDTNHGSSPVAESSPSQPPPSPTTSHGPSAVTWVFAGAAVVALGTFAYFGTTGQGDLNDLRSSCGNRCARTDVDAAWNKLVMADVALGVGVGAAAVATVLFFTTRGSKENPAGSHAPSSATSTLGAGALSGVQVVPGIHGATLLWDARF